MKDDETGFYYCHARYYDAKMGKFISAEDRIDGLFSSAGQNMYMYCHGNPIMYSDPDGHGKVGAVLGYLAFPLGGPVSAYVGHKIQDKFFGGKKGGGRSNSSQSSNQNLTQNSNQNVITPVLGTQGKVTLNSPWPKRASSNQNHNGCDLGGSENSPVATMTGGQVILSYAGDGNHVGGVYIKNGDVETRYMHVTPRSGITNGTMVQPGQIIGDLNDSGKDVGSWFGWHLHFEVYKNGVNSNPIEFILNTQPNLIWRFMDSDNKNYMMNNHPNLYNSMIKE